MHSVGTAFSELGFLGPEGSISAWAYCRWQWGTGGTGVTAIFLNGEPLAVLGPDGSIDFSTVWDRVHSRLLDLQGIRCFALQLTALSPLGLNR